MKKKKARKPTREVLNRLKPKVSKYHMDKEYRLVIGKIVIYKGKNV